MQANKQHSNPEHPTHSKFLTRHHSATTLSFFNCCSATDLQHIDTQKQNNQRTHTNKLSMKNLLKKSAIYADKAPSTYNQSRTYLTSKHSDNHSLHYIHSRKPSGISQVDRSAKQHKIERRPVNKISFNYIKEHSNPPGFINNYHTTNYIVEKYIVQPQQMKLIVKDAHNTHQSVRSQQVYSHNYSNGRYFDLSGEFEEQQSHKQSPKWSNQPYSLAGDGRTNKSPRGSYQNSGNNCHFSFGQHQKNTFMSKYMNIGAKEVQSKRHSQNSKDSSMPMPSLQTSKFKADELLSYTEQEYPLLKNSFKKTNLAQFQQQDFNIIDSEQYDSQCSSQNSEVIDSYQSIMRRMSESPNSRGRYEG